MTLADLSAAITDNRETHRYELTVDGQTAVVLYNEVAGGLLVTETLVPVPLEGKGIASRLARHVLADIRRRGLLILPTCPFFAGYLQKHPAEYADIVHPSYRIALGI
jgi:predicted GNAT family acetyltransferase